MTFKKTKLALLIALAMQQLSAPALAQNTAPSNPATDADSLPEISVTSDKPDNDFSPGVSTVGGKTVTALRDIPQSVTVVNRAVLDSQGAATLQEALRNVPGITIGGAEGGQIGKNIIMV